MSATPAARFSVPLSFLLLFALAGLVQAGLGGVAGLLTCIAGILILYWRRWRLRQRLLHWSSKLDTPPPPALHDYDPLIANIYRQHRKLRQQCADSQACYDDWQAMLNALPFGMLRLDQALQVQWCNRMAGELLPVQAVSDMGYRVTNVLRQPAFVRYAEDRSRWATETVTLNLPHGMVTLRLVADAGDGAILLATPQAAAHAAS